MASESEGDTTTHQRVRPRASARASNAYLTWFICIVLVLIGDGERKCCTHQMQIELLLDVNVMKKVVIL